MAVRVLTITVNHQAVTLWHCPACGCCTLHTMCMHSKPGPLHLRVVSASAHAIFCDISPDLQSDPVPDPCLVVSCNRTHKHDLGAAYIR